MRRLLIQIGQRAADFVRMALRQVLLQRGPPSAVRIPNAETIAALNEPTHNLKQFDSVEDLFADIKAATSGSRAGAGRTARNPHRKNICGGC